MLSERPVHLADVGTQGFPRYLPQLSVDSTAVAAAFARRRLRDRSPERDSAERRARGYGVDMNVTVVGSGNGGLATAFDLALHGHSVRLFDTPHFPDHVAEVATAGGIEGCAEITYSGHDIETALDGSELVVLVGPAYSTEHQATVVAPHLVPG